MISRLRVLSALIVFAFVAGTAGEAPAQTDCCIVPDNGTGTADLPPTCPGGYTGEGEIRDGLPSGSTVVLAVRLANFSLTNTGAGGGLGGEFQQWSANLILNLTGTGVFTGYNRLIILPTSGETHSGPRTLFAPVQSFPMDMYGLQGQIIGDPDFDLLRITGGTGFGMPSPGQTTLTQTGGGWAVDSFFDITYRVDFVGSPGGTFAGMSGSTTNLIERFDMCHEQPTPASPATWGQLKAAYR
jgi:hypothetical protein